METCAMEITNSAFKSLYAALCISIALFSSSSPFMTSWITASAGKTNEEILASDLCCIRDLIFCVE